MDQIPDATTLIEEAVRRQRDREAKFEQLVADKILDATALGRDEVSVDTAGIDKRVVEEITTRLEKEKGFVCTKTMSGFIVSWEVAATIVSVDTAIAKRSKTESSGSVTIQFGSKARAAQLMRYYQHIGHPVDLLHNGMGVQVSWPTVGKKD
jgi:hypothetical protein